jgi:7,8-dihydropterin-6-yl-methyl-4-(beta-D-ribofuranosyl)aminobenzene 5'-phosphate synthase
MKPALVLLSLLLAQPAATQPRESRRVRSVRVTVLSTMLASRGIGEWGFAALVEADDHRILFDTGAHPETALANAREMGIDLSEVPDVILSHNHADHTGGLLTLRRAFSKKNAQALSRAHVAEGIFLSRREGGSEQESNPMIAAATEYRATGARIIETGKPLELYPGVWLTGPVPRKYPERNWSPGSVIRTAAGSREDDLPEDQSLVIDTDRGLVVISGCGHAGIVNTLEYARRVVREAPVEAAIGGFHLFALDDKKLEWTASKLREFGTANFLGAHCTGIEAVYLLRKFAGLERRTCTVGAVGSVYDLSKGLDPGPIAR